MGEAHFPTRPLELDAKLVQCISQALSIHSDHVDLIQLSAAKLDMRKVVVNQGIPLKGEQALAQVHFLTQTCTEVEDFYWLKNHAA